MKSVIKNGHEQSTSETKERAHAKSGSPCERLLWPNEVRQGPRGAAGAGGSEYLVNCVSTFFFQILLSRSRRQCYSGQTRGPGGINPNREPLFKNWFNIGGYSMSTLSDIKLIRTDTTL